MTAMISTPARSADAGATEREPDGTRHLRALDGVRGLSILAVIGVHLNLSFAPGGGMGVMVFFVLSGYLITALLLSERGRFGRVNFGFFYARRALRLLPALLMVIVATCAIALTERNLAVARQTLHFAPAALFYVANWVTALNSSFVGGTLAHTWSLSVEEQFYIVWPVLLGYLLVRGARPRTIVLVALAGALGSDLGKLLLWTGGGSLAAHANRMYGADLSGDALLIGCALAVAARSNPQRTLRIARLAALPGAIYLAVVVTVVHPYGGSYADTRAFMVIAWPMTSVAAAGVIGYVSLAPQSALSRLLGIRPLAYVGRISYGLYLWHYPIIIWMAVWFGFALDHQPLWQLGVDLAVIFLVAAASYHLVERRALRLKRRVRPHLPAPVPARATTAMAPSPGTSVIELHELGKRYDKMQERGMLLTSILPFRRPARESLWALRGLDLTVSAGEIVGVLGHNGAGKTTLLRLLAGVTSPSEGELRVVGRIAPLISLGVGFHQEMSGRENVLVNGMLLGLTAGQVAERFDSIVAFAELEEFIDTPVKFYSSGMYMRLGFAVVVHVDPTILLVDEILAVGDAGFQLKCFERLRELREQGAAIIVVSHSLHTVRQLCRRAILIRHGKLVYDGEVEHAIAMHESLLAGGEEAGRGPVEIIEERLVGPRGPVAHAAYDDPLELRLRLRFHARVDDPQIAFGSITTDGRFGGASATAPGERWRTFEPGEEADVAIGFRARMGPDRYRLPVEVKRRDGGKVLCRSDGVVLTVTGAGDATGLADVAARFALERRSATLS